MKATLTFNLPDDDFQFKCASQAESVIHDIHDISMDIRSRFKYEEGIGDEEDEFLRGIYCKLSNIIDRSGLE